MERCFAYIGIVMLASCALSSCSGHDNDPMPPAPVDTGLEWDEGNWDEQEWQ